MSEPYFFFRPVISPDHGWSAVEWLAADPATVDSENCLQCFRESGAAQLSRLLPLILSVKPAWLEQSAFTHAFDASQVILIAPSHTLDNALAVGHCKHFRAEGYHLGLAIDAEGMARKIPLDSFDHVSLPAAFARHTLPGSELNYLGDAGLRKIALAVNTHELFAWLAEHSFDLCGCAYLTTHNPARGREPDLTRLKLLKLLNLVAQDGDTREIEAVFREEPKLSYNLLRLVNSVAVGARTRISNFSQAITILGRRQLHRWLQLLIYANNLADGNAPNPLMQLAAQRARLLELLSKLGQCGESAPANGDSAFMAGLFSLLDVLINLPMADILREVPLEEEVITALLSPREGGMLGQLLGAVTAGETGDFAQAREILSRLGISPREHAEAQIAALYWAGRINADNQD